MKGFLFCLVLLGGVGFAAYYFEWVSFEKTEDGNTQISIDNNKFREDANKALDKGRDVIDNAADRLNQDGDSQGDQSSNSSNDGSGETSGGN